MTQYNRVLIDDAKVAFFTVLFISLVQRQKGLTGYCFKYIDRPFCLQTDDVLSPSRVFASLLVRNPEFWSYIYTLVF